MLSCHSVMLRYPPTTGPPATSRGPGCDILPGPWPQGWRQQGPSPHGDAAPSQGLTATSRLPRRAARRGAACSGMRAPKTSGMRAPRAAGAGGGSGGCDSYHGRGRSDWYHGMGGGTGHGARELLIRSERHERFLRRCIRFRNKAADWGLGRGGRGSKDRDSLTPRRLHCTGSTGKDRDSLKEPNARPHQSNRFLRLLEGTATI